MHRSSDFNNPLYNERVSITEPADVVAPAQHNGIDAVLDNASMKSTDENHTYDVIPANRSNSTAIHKRSVLSNVTATPPPIPSRMSICDTNNHNQSKTLASDTRNPQGQSTLVGIPQRQSVVQSEDSTLEAQEHIYHVLEQGAEKSSSPDTDTTEGLLEERGMKDPVGRVSWSGPKNGEGGVTSLACSEEWEGKEPTSYRGGPCEVVDCQR